MTIGKKLTICIAAMLAVVLGLAAAAYALVTFVTSAPRHIWDTGGDRIVKNNRVITIGDTIDASLVRPRRPRARGRGSSWSW